VDNSLHFGQLPDPAVVETIADFICGDIKERYPVYRSSSYLTRFFQNIGINVAHDGSTRKWWVLETLNRLIPTEFEKVLLRLVDPKEYKGDQKLLAMAYKAMNELLGMEAMKIEYIGATPTLKRIQSINIDGDKLSNNASSDNEINQFLKKDYSDEIDINKLNLDSVITQVLTDRVNEARRCLESDLNLSLIFQLGSTLEGILLGVALKNQKEFMTNNSAPKDKNGYIKKIYDWTLSDLIDVSYSTKRLKLDVKKFSHALRDFRNFIHPHEQVAQAFNPDENTAHICWQVFKAAYSQLISEDKT